MRLSWGGPVVERVLAPVRSKWVGVMVVLAILASIFITAVGICGLSYRCALASMKVDHITAYRGLFHLQPLPPPGEEVLVLCQDEHRQTSVIEAVYWPYLGWTDAVSLLMVEGSVLGWRPQSICRGALPLLDIHCESLGLTRKH